MAERDKPDAILIEDKASGQSLIQELRDNTNLPIVAIQPDADKETRARACAGQFEAGKVVFPQQAPWLSDVERQLLLFPNSKNDDIVDSISQFLRYMRDKKGTTPDEYAKVLAGIYE